MRRIGIIGSGQACRFLARTLPQEIFGEYHITMSFQKSAQDWLHKSWFTGSSTQYSGTFDFERQLPGAVVERGQSCAHYPDRHQS